MRIIFAVRSSQFAIFLLKKLRNFYRKTFRFIFKSINRLRLKNKQVSIIASDCVGTFIMHDLKMRFDTPTVNLYFTSADFVKFCRNLKYYLSQEVRECENSGKDFPVGTIGSAEDMITLYFMHYENFQQAKAKWEERSKRIHWDKLYVILPYGEKLSRTVIEEFDALPYEHKVLLTYKELDGIKSAVKVNCGKRTDSPFLFEYPSGLSVLRFMDRWDYVSFLNS